MRRVAYPAVRRSCMEYVLHGRSIPDPYSALEDPASDECKQFVTNQNEMFEQFMQDHTNMRTSLFDKITKLQNYARTSTVMPRGDFFYYYHNTGLQNQSVLKRSKALHEDGEVFMDPNTLSADGTTALKSTAWSEDETLWAYSISEKGSDWQTIHIRNAVTKEDLADKIDWVKFSGIAWLKNIGFFYTRYPELAAGQEKGAETDTALDAAIYFHRVGTSQSSDVLIVNVPEHRTWSLGAEVSDCDRYVIVSIHEGCERKSLIWLADIDPLEGPRAGPLTFNKIINEFEGDYSYLGNDDSVFYFTSTKNAPKTCVIALDITTKKETTVVSEKASVLSFASLVGNKLILSYLEDVKDVVYVATLGDVENTLVKLPLPIGTVEAISCHRKKSHVSIKITSFLLPGRTYTLDMSNPVGTLALYKNDVSEGFNADDFTTTQVFYSSKDGTKIPMFILHRNGIKMDGKNPLLVYGYGGFNISLTPGFSPSRIVFLDDLGGVLAIPNIRGGGEYGQDWHDAGRKKNKQNCFTDFAEAIRFLHGQGYGSPSTTAIMGGSNGGLLVAATANQAPELLKAVVCQVGVLDMYKFHRFTIGHAWKSDYGDPDVEEDFAVLEQYSPIHNIRTDTVYPAILVVTGDHDDRVVPLHSHKYVATLQHLNPEAGGPFLARIEVSAGHGAGKPTSKRLQEAADTYTFIAKALNIQSKTA